MAEIEKGWLVEGTNPDLDKLVVARRFGLAQKLKVRVIDDCSVGGYNKAYGTKEKLRVHAIDQLAAYLRWICIAHGTDLSDEIVGRT